MAVAAIRAGAHDYIVKDRLRRLVPAVERELRDAVARREQARARAQREPAARPLRHILAPPPDAIFPAALGLRFPPYYHAARRPFRLSRDGRQSTHVGGNSW